MHSWYSDGIHLEIDHLHLLFDPTVTENANAPRDSYADYLKKRNKQEYNSDFEHLDLILISHAHSDHCDRSQYFASTNIPIITHPMTADFRSTWLQYVPNKSSSNITLITEGKTVYFHHLKISAYPNGHCGGGLMFYIEGNEGTVLFTGDINTEISLASFPAEAYPCDLLLIEATFGKPEFSFPPRADVYNQIYDWIEDRFNVTNDPTKKTHKAVLIYGQALGKIQDMIKLLHNIENLDLSLLLDSYSSRITHLYERYYGTVGQYQEINDVIICKSNTAIISSMKGEDDMIDDIDHIIEQFGLEDDPPIALLSGWAKTENTKPADEPDQEGDGKFDKVLTQYSDVANFQISSHNGYNLLLDFIDQCSPAQIGIFHGYSAEFADSLTEKGYIAFDLHKRDRHAQ